MALSDKTYRFSLSPKENPSIFLETRLPIPSNPGCKQNFPHPEPISNYCTSIN
jgi:hypothetical protein